MGKRQRQRHEGATARGSGRRLPGCLRWPASLLVVALAAASALLKCYMLAKALLSGVYTSGSRFGPLRVYPLEADPQRYWFWMAWDGVFTVLSMLLAVAIAWVFLVLDKPK